jgi:hypothetical protein
VAIVAHPRGLDVATVTEPSYAHATANWKAHLEHSDHYEGKTQGYSETHRTGNSDARPKPGDAATTGCVASRSSGVFHRAGCKGAAKISEKNLVRYATREEAIRAGKQPCHECNP